MEQQPGADTDPPRSSDSAPSDLPVVIVGAGPTGLTAAVLLAQYGVACTVLDRWPDAYAQPRAVHLDDEVYRILGRMGLAEAFAAVSRPVAGLRLLDPDRKVLAEFRRDAAIGRHGFPQANLYDQPRLEQLLRARIDQLELVTLRGGLEVTGLDRSSADHVAIDVRDRETGKQQRLAARYVLGCDGANSTIRGAIGASMRDLGSAQRWMIVDIRSARDLGHWPGVHQVCDPQRAATYMQIGADRHRWEFRLNDGELVEQFADLSRLAELLAPWTGPARLADLELVRLIEYTFRAQVADRWRDGRVFLLGDAAHLTPPFIGQGLGSGLRDAMNLTWKLAGVLAGTLPEGSLDTYADEREPHARDLIRIAVGIGWAMTAGGRAGDLARTVLAPRLHLVPGLRRRITDGVSPPLRSSALVHRRGPRSLAGTLVPNPVLPGGSRFDAVAAGRFVVVTTVPPTAPQRARIEQRGARLVQVARHDRLGGWLRRHLLRVAVIRPDGTVLAGTRSLDAACEQLPYFGVTPGRAPAASRVPP